MPFIRLNLSVRLLLIFVSLQTIFLFVPTRSEADSLTVAILTPAQTGLAGQTIIFQGSIFNNTGVDLSATELFFDFFGFNPSLTVNQQLGVPDFSILNGTTSSVVNLFSVTLGSEAGSFPVDFVLQDINGNLSVPGQVTVGSSVATPEPPTILLFFIGLLMVIVGCSSWFSGLRWLGNYSNQGSSLTGR